MKRLLFLVASVCASACASGHRYADPSVDFGAVKTVAVLPFVNLSKETQGAERARDVFSSFLLASGAVYVLPSGEVQRGLIRAGIQAPATPSKEEIVKLGAAIAAEAIITGVVREYGEIRSGQSAANVISMSVQMIEASSGRVMWSASTTKGGIGFSERLLGGGGAPMNEVTEEAVRELLRRLRN